MNLDLARAFAEEFPEYGPAIDLSVGDGALRKEAAAARDIAALY